MLGSVTSDTAKLILACDTTQGACSVVLYRGAVLAHRLTPMRKGHAEALIPMMQEVMDEAGCAMADIERLAVTNGPGTFTGTRVGLSAMRGMALALKIPLKAYGTLQVMAQAALSDAKLIVAVDARRDTYYVQSFAAQENGFRAPLSDPQALSAQAAAALISDKEFALLGSGAQALAQAVSQASKAKTHIDEAADFPDALHVARLAEVDADWQEGALPLPLYLRPPDATLPRRDKFPTRAPSDETGN